MNISSIPDACNINIYNPTYLIIYVTLVNYKIKDYHNMQIKV